MICKHCNVETALSGGAHANHVAWCHSNPKRSERAKALIKSRERLKGKPGSNQHTHAAKEGRKLEVSQETKDKIGKAGTGRLHNEETKEKLSEIRRKWLQDNPDLHPWKRNDKFKSVPCEVLKACLRDSGLQFEEEYTPLQDRSFAVDIAFPEARIAVEVNGEQHYNRDGTLRTYYRERHELIEKCGWHVVELHYTKCYEPHVRETLALISSLL